MFTVIGGKGRNNCTPKVYNKQYSIGMHDEYRYWNQSTVVIQMKGVVFTAKF